MSLRSRLTVLSALVLVAALVLFTVVTVDRTRGALAHRGDEELAVMASGLVGLARGQVQRAAEGRAPARYDRLEAMRRNTVFQGYAVVVQPDGSTLPLPQLAEDSSDPPAVPRDVFARQDQPPFDLLAPDGSEYRAQITGVPGGDAVMYIAVSTERLKDTTDELVSVHVATGLALLVVFLVATAGAVRLGLRPLTAVTRTAARIADGSTGERVRAGPTDTEIGALSQAVNTMLDTVEQAVEDRTRAQERTERFAADAAHELRTPVAAVLGYTDLYRSGGIDPTDHDRLDEVFDRLAGEATRLRDLVDSLLFLDRLDQHGDDAGGVTDLADVAATVAADSMTIDPGHPVSVDAPGRVWAAVAPDHAVRILANLLANVRRHTPPGTETVVALRTLPGTCELDVTDDGPGIDAADRDRVFDRFHRADPSRARGLGGGSGLGLAIVASLADNAGGSAHLDQAPGGGARFRVILPAAPPSPG